MDDIEKVGSRLDKESILKELDKPGQRLLKWSLDPATTFGVTVDEDEYDKLVLTDDSQHSFWDCLDVLCDALSKREFAGYAARDAVQYCLTRASCSNDLKWAVRVLNKNLRCGVQITTANKIFPGLIKPFKVSLAEPYKPEKHEISGQWCIEPKLDGLRMTIVRGVPYTRNGRVINTVNHILEELYPFLYDYVFDGEVMGAGDFDEASGIIRRKETCSNSDIYYNVFDVIPREQWITRKTVALTKRKDIISSIFHVNTKHCSFKHVKAVEWLLLPNNPTTEQLFEMRDEMMKRGYEGSMLKNMNAPYRFERSNDVLKLKDFNDVDCILIDSYEGKGRHKGRLGGIVVELDGVQTRVGSGFTDKQRDDLWVKRNDIVGSVVEVQYQNKTPDGSLRFPVYIKFRSDKE